MKSRIRVLLITGTFLFLSAIIAQKTMAQNYVSFQVFYDQLDPYGQWVDYPDYGYVWIPEAGPDFMPYASMGHWIFTEYGWTWVSAYEWGWAPFHYGRWDYDNYLGWFWIPDNEWGPAWVSWRRADGYYGWEPMGPGISISLSFGREYDRRHDHWIFVRDRDFDRQDINNFYVDRSQNARIVRNSTIINNTYIDHSRNTTYVTGPGRDDIQRGTGRQVNSVNIREDSRPGQKMDNGDLRIYRPQVNKNNERDQKPAPLKVSNRQDVKPTGERRETTRQENKYRPPQGGTSNPSESNVKQTESNVKQNKITPQNNSTRSKVSRPETIKEQKRRNEGSVQNKPVSPQNENQSVKSTREKKTNTVKPEKSRRSAQQGKSKSDKEKNK